MNKHVAYLGFGGLILSGLIVILIKKGNPNEIKVGMKVTNGYCTGQVAAVNSYSNEAYILLADCGEVSITRIYLPLNDLTETL